MKAIEGGITAPRGYRASGVHVGIKGHEPDLAVVFSETNAAVAGVFATNKLLGAHVPACRKRLAGGTARAIVVNSGNANACTGPQGTVDAERMADAAAFALSVPAPCVFVCSTGTIGIPMPMDTILAGIPKAVGELSDTGGGAAARAIMTTDTRPKEVAVELKIGEATIRIGGMAKGAGMIEPNMATMLAFLTTDAAVEPGALQNCLREAVTRSFNRITVDGCQSCNDTVLFLANGAAGGAVLDEHSPHWKTFRDAVLEVSLRLSTMIVEDGEGATKLVAVEARGAVSDEDALRAARTIANSMLVKTSWYGGDPNWGRIIDAIGYSGAEMDPDRVDIFYDGLCVVRGGCPAGESALDDLRAVLAKQRFSLTVDLGLGQGRDTVYTCDLTDGYVKINADYMT